LSEPAAHALLAMLSTWQATTPTLQLRLLADDPSSLLPPVEYFARAAGELLG
jgi:hypothetical protein